MGIYSVIRYLGTRFGLVRTESPTGLTEIIEDANPDTRGSKEVVAGFENAVTRLMEEMAANRALRCENLPTQEESDAGVTLVIRSRPRLGVVYS